MPEYRDYGYIGDVPPEPTPVNTTRRGLVYQATHKGEVRLSLMNRSFISFSYGGRYIEDFNLLATIANNRIDRRGYAAFRDNTTTYDNLDGLYYWGTHYNSNELNFYLSTDGINQRYLDDFLYWFHAGEVRELILSEHPNRAILARVAEPPQLSLLPFEEKLEVKLFNTPYMTSTTLYKGEILLHLVMDEPFWYAKTNILGKSKNGTYVDLWDDPISGLEISIFSSQDALKILYEDGIPLGSMISANMLLGNGGYANVLDDINTLIWDPNTSKGARIYGTVDNVLYEGYIAGAIVNSDGDGIIELPQGSEGYFFYAGTAPAYTIISFELTPYMGDYWILCPRNSIYSPETPYNRITIESLHTLYLDYTTPNILTSYNKVILIFRTYLSDNTKTYNDLRNMLRNEIRHNIIRLWAIKTIDIAESKNSRSYANCLLFFSYVIRKDDDSVFPMRFIFNSETGSAIGEITYRQVPSNATDLTAAAAKTGVILSQPVEEDVGDMLKSNYIIIRDRNYADKNGYITNWNKNDANSDPLYSHVITHDSSATLRHFSVIYKNMYL